MRDTITFEAREIGAFLRAQRMNTAAPDLYKSSRKRHRPYMTQQELAEKADVSVVLIGQVESGRYQNLNAAILSRLCRALELSSTEERYVVRLLSPPAEKVVDLYPEVPPFVRAIVDAAEPNPAMIITPRFDIIYWNQATTRLMMDFATVPREMRNVVASMFGIPQMREMWVDWEKNARLLTAGLRMMMSQVPSFRKVIQEFADEMRARHPEFAQWWVEASPEMTPSREKDFIHPRVGMLHLYQTVSQVVGAEHLSFLQFTPRDAATAEAIKRM